MAATSQDFLFGALDTSLLGQTTATLDDTSMKNSIYTSENTNMINAVNMADTNSSGALTYGMYLNRNKTVADTAVELTRQNKSIKDGTSETSARQGEINEWASQNKLDTLFFLQTLFLYLMSFIVITYMWRYGLLPGSTYYWVLAILTLIIIGIFLNRYLYTSKIRDNRYWNRRYLTLDKGLLDETKEECESESSS
jgi:hypothetical protein